MNETIFYNNMAVPADTISGRHVEGLSLACMTNSAGNSCLVESQDWVGSGMIYNADGKLPWACVQTLLELLLINHV